MIRSKRALKVDALDALVDGRIAAVAKARDWELLEEIARLVQADAPLELAATDPAMFATLRHAITRFHLKGWSAMTPERVRRIAEESATAPKSRVQAPLEDLAAFRATMPRLRRPSADLLREMRDEEE
jgi:hypothetical protein